MTEKLFLYYRVSSIDQAQKDTDENQENHIKKFLANRDVQIIDEFRDKGISGADPDRAGYNSMLARIQEIDAIAVYDIDRLTRDFDIGMDLITRLRKYNKKLYVSRQGREYDLHNFTDLFFHVNMIMMADEERKKINQRREEGMKRYISEHGKWPHRPLKPIKWDQVDKMREAGVSMAAIARSMNVDRKTLYKRMKTKE